MRESAHAARHPFIAPGDYGFGCDGAPDSWRRSDDSRAKSREMRHVEFLGLPAAGKTTLVEKLLQGTLVAERAVVAPLTRTPVTLSERVARRYRDVVSVAGQLLGSPRKSLRIWHACRAFRQPSVSLWLRMYLSCLRVDWLARRTRKVAGETCLVILDQGVYQAVWSMALRAKFNSDDRFRRACVQLLDCLARPALVILVDTPADVVHQRLASEPKFHGRLPKLLESNSDWMEHTKWILGVLWEIADSEPSVATLRHSSATDRLSDIEHAIERISDAAPGV